MGIKFKYDAVAVPPFSEEKTKDFGQKLVQQQKQANQQTAMQQQALKYNAQQQGYDRLFTLNRDAMQNEMAFRKEGRDNQFLAEQQRRADFQAARNRMDTHAKDALNNPNLPPELRQKIQNLINGKMAVLGSGYNETQQQQFLDQYNSELAGLLSEVPAQQPMPTAQEQFDQGVVTRNGVDYIQDSKGKWVPLETGQQSSGATKQQQQPQRFTSAEDAFLADPKTRKEYMDEAILMERGGNDSDPLDDAMRDRALDKAKKNYEKDHGLGTPTPAAPKASGQPTPTSPPEMRSILESPPPAPLTSQQQIDQAVPMSPIPTTPASQAPTPLPKDNWSEVIVPKADSQQPLSASGQPLVDNKPLAAPDFVALASSAQDAADRAVIGKLQGIHKTAKPEVQSAINVLVDPGADPKDVAAALDYLKAAGIDIEQLAPVSHYGSGNRSGGKPTMDRRLRAQGRNR